MKKQAQKSRTLEFIHEYWINKNTTNDLQDFVSSEVIYSGSTFGKKFFGLNALKNVREVYDQSFPELKVKCLEKEESDGVSHTSWEVKAKHLGPYKPVQTVSLKTGEQLTLIEPTHKEINYHADLIIFFKGKKIYKYIALIDMENFLRQMGIFKQKESYQGQREAFNNKCLIVSKLKETLNPLLTERELECLSLNLRGLSAKQSGCILSISQRTVETHLSHGFGKLDCFNKYQCLEMMYENHTLPIWLDLSNLIMEQNRSHLITQNGVENSAKTQIYS